MRPHVDSSRASQHPEIQEIVVHLHGPENRDQNQADLTDRSGLLESSGSSKEDDSAWQDAAEALSPRSEFQQLSRHPDSTEQVNLNRVVDLSNVPLVPELEEPGSDEPCRSGRKKTRPERYQ